MDPFHHKDLWKYTAMENGELSVTLNLTHLMLQLFAINWAIMITWTTEVWELVREFLLIV